MLGITLFEVVFNDGVTNVWNAVCKVRCSGYEFWTSVCENVTTIASWGQSFVADISVNELSHTTIVIDIEKCNTFQRNTHIGICTIDVTKGISNVIQKFPVFSSNKSKIIGYFSLKVCTDSLHTTSQLVDSNDSYISSYDDSTDYTTSQAYHLRIDILKLEGLPAHLVNPYVTCEFRSIRLRTDSIHPENDSNDTNTVRSYVFNQSFSLYTLNHNLASDSITLKLFATGNSLISLGREIATGILSYNLLKVQPLPPCWFNLYTQIDGEKVFYGRLLVSSKCARATQLDDAKIIASPFYTLPLSTQFNIFVDLYRIVTSFSNMDLLFEVKCGSSFKRILIGAGKNYLSERIVIPINLPDDMNELDKFKTDYYLEFRIYLNKQVIAHKFTRLKKLFNWQSFTIKSPDDIKFDYLSILMGVEISASGSSPPMRLRLLKRPFTYRLQIISAKSNPPTYINSLNFNLAIAGTVKSTSQVTSTSSNPLLLQTVNVNAEVDVREIGESNPLLYLCPINIQLIKFIGSLRKFYSGTLKLKSDKFTNRVILNNGWEVLVNFNLIPNGVSLPIWQPVFKQVSFIISFFRILLYNNKYNIEGGNYIFQIYGQTFEFKRSTSKIFRFSSNYPINVHNYNNSNGNLRASEKINVTINNIKDQSKNLAFTIPLNGIEKVIPLTTNDDISNSKKYSINNNDLPIATTQGFENLPIGSDAILHKFRGVYVKQNDSNIMIPKSFLLISGVNGDEFEVAKAPITMESITPLPYESATIYECRENSTSVKIGKVKFFTTIYHKDSIISGGKMTSDGSLDEFSSIGRKFSAFSLVIKRALCIPFPTTDLSIEFVLGEKKEVVKVDNSNQSGMNLHLNLFWQHQLVVYNTPYLSISIISGKKRVSGIIDLEDLWYSVISTKTETIRMDGGGYLEVEYELIPNESTPTLTPPQSMKSKYELRLVIWSILNVPSGAIDGYVGVRLYIPGYDCKFPINQFTDLHYNCGGETAMYNWRFVYPGIPYPFSSCILQISFFDYKKLGTPLLIGECNLDLKDYFHKIENSGRGIQEDTTVLLSGNSKAQLSIHLLNQTEANANPVGLGRNEPNLNPKLLNPTQGRAWKDLIKSAESSLGIKLSMDLSTFYLFIRIGSVVLTFIAMIIIALVYPAIFA